MASQWQDMCKPLPCTYPSTLKHKVELDGGQSPKLQFACKVSVALPAYHKKMLNVLSATVT